MTREEEITKEAKKFAREIDDWEIAEDVQDAFEQGAEWADANPNKDNMATAYKAGEVATIDKACEWLEEHLLDFWSQKITNTDYFIEEFKKAMKE